MFSTIPKQWFYLPSGGPWGLSPHQRQGQKNQKMQQLRCHRPQAEDASCRNWWENTLQVTLLELGGAGGSAVREEKSPPVQDQPRVPMPHQEALRRANNTLQASPNHSPSKTGDSFLSVGCEADFLLSSSSETSSQPQPLLPEPPSQAQPSHQPPFDQP